ncbi:unnamed protein product [Thelazia callipaeda]|uniref:NB-ARC domain-containing protein n=1 Tax=Thelazia callipaeda TaxID=103827 RepID=A0A0N5CQ46_THECL|nr:unnamed protein product [Thelazia callipaeda]
MLVSTSISFVSYFVERMLVEQQNRVLSIAMEALVQDFEPRDAIPFMCSKDIFNDDQQEIILALASYFLRTLRVMEFLRQYRKAANSLDPLIKYFEQYGQKHLACLLSKEYVPDERPLLSSNDLEDRLFKDGHVPRLPSYCIMRTNLLEKLKNLLIDLSFRDHFWLIVHGFPGCGKSFLASSVLQAYPILLSRYYEHVIWVEDGRTNRSQVSDVISNFVFLATDALFLTGKETVAQILLYHINFQAKAALREKPNTLVVLNDVYLQKIVRWFDKLNCRILATSRNVDIFQVCYSNPVYFSIDPPGLSLSETEMMFKELHSSNLEISLCNDSQLCHIHKKTMGLPALLGILRQQICSDHNNFHNLLSMLNYCSIAAISNFTYYNHKNMISAIMESYKLLTKRQKVLMETFIIFGPDEWIPLEFISLCIAFDICGTNDVSCIVLQELKPLINASLVNERIIDCSVNSSYTRPLFYDYQINSIMHSFLCTIVDRQNYFHSFIRPSVSTFLSQARCRDTDFMQRVQSFIDLHPLLFQEIPYENCLQSELAKQYVQEGLHISFTDSEQLKDQNIKKAARSWSDICIFM